jgi:ADP-ribose pyrophosphatase YjhB (NUDIX family)
MTISQFVIAVLVLIEQNRKFLLVQESKVECRKKWFLPGGRVNSGESVLQAALREVREETGITPELTGLLYIDQMPGAEFDETPNRIRFVFVGKAGTGALKQSEDEHSIDAQWFSEKEALKLDLRSPYVLKILEIYRKDPVILPISKVHVFSHADRLLERP